jgi:hypothetical protein
MEFQSLRKVLFASVIGLLAVLPEARADGIVSAVTSAPIHPNGIVRDIRSGLNIHLQSEIVQGLDYMDPAVEGYGIPAGGALEIELVEGFQRDPAVPLDDRAILLTTGTPQQGLPAGVLGMSIKEGKNDRTFVITANGKGGLDASKLVSPAPGSAFDPIRATGIKIIHIGRNKAFVSRGKVGRVEVRFVDGAGDVISKGQGTVEFLTEPRPQIYPTNIPHDQRNHNWQRVPVRNIVGVASNTLPMSLILYKTNEGLEKKGISGAGVISSRQLKEGGYKIPESLARFNGGLIIQDTDGDELLNPNVDQIIGGVSEMIPEGATGNMVLTPLVNEKPFLSVETSMFNERAAKTVGGSVMQVVYIAGDKPGKYRITFSLLEKPSDLSSDNGSSYTYTVVAE